MFLIFLFALETLATLAACELLLVVAVHLIQVTEE